MLEFWTTVNVRRATWADINTGPRDEGLGTATPLTSCSEEPTAKWPCGLSYLSTNSKPYVLRVATS